MLFYYHRTFKIGTFLFLLCQLTNCTQQQTKDNILAIVGDRVITTSEFIRRAEYTIRPLYCKRNSNVEKNIILNSIIAEKLFAFEAGEDNSLVHSTAFQAYIRGRKEQFMRQYLFDDLVKNKIKPSKSEFEQRYRVAGREYRLAFFTTNQTTAQEIAEMSEESRTMDFFDCFYSKTG